MNRFRARFPKTPAVFPVVHVTSTDQALRNVAIAVTAGADGVFLINHVIPADVLLDAHDKVRAAYPDLWVGVNCLDRTPTWTAARPDVLGMWADNAYVRTGTDEQPIAAASERHRRSTGWDGLFFGGVAFKGQRGVPEHLYGDAAARAVPYVDVVTTSGQATGMPAFVGKVRAMREALGDHPLALASGVTPDNVHEYVPYVDAFLVATGISRDFNELDLELTRRLVEAVRG